jgi:phage recombination protein Bet
MIRHGSKVTGAHAAKLTAARRMSVWDLIHGDSETARVLAQELPLTEQLRASLERTQRTKKAKPMETTTIATIEPSHQLAPVLPESKLALLRDTYARGATEQEFELFVSVCNRLRLDPFARQIYAVKRWNTELRREELQPQVSIDGMRLTAQRTGEYRGQSAPEWCGPDGIWRDVWLGNQPPAAARVQVYREGFVQPVTAVALYSEYVARKRDGSPTHFWVNMPANQLAKCAESLALRKAFPNELSGVYSVDEMDQAQDAPAMPKPAAVTQQRTIPAANGGKPQPKPKPQPEPKPAAQPAPAQPPQQQPAPEPCFARSFPIKAWAGKPMRSADAEALRDYVAFCEGVLGDRSRSWLHTRVKASMEQAELVYGELIQREAGGPPPEETTQVIGVDAINAAMDAEYARTRSRTRNPNTEMPNDDDLPY